MLYYIFFFFQAEDGIRDYKVTGVQTCALPISHDLPGARLGHIRHDVDVLGPRDLADHFLVRLHHPVDDGLTRRHARLERDVHFRHASLELVLDRDDGGFGDLGDGETGGLDLLRAQAVTRDIDHVIDTAEDAVIAIGRLHRAVAAQERPVTPVLAPGVLVVLAVVRFDEIGRAHV